MRAVWISLLLCASLLSAAERADLIVTAGKVVTMDAQRRVLSPGAVAVRDGRIAAIGTPEEIRAAWTARTTIDRPGAILTPGLINTHTHAAMSLLRGVADDMRLQDWLENYIFPAEAKNVTAEFVEHGTRLAVLEMLLGGTTTYTDMYYFEDTVAKVTKAAGMRAVLGETIIGFPAPDNKTPADALAATEKFILAWKNDPLITPAVAPHAIYTNSAETLKAARALADRHGVPMLIHVSETKKENDDSQAKNGASPTVYLDRIGAIANRSVFAHCTYTDAEDHRIMARHNVGVAHCPSSNTKLASGIAPIVPMLKAGLATGLGPDGPAGSNNDFNLFEEMDLASKIAKVSNMDPQVLPAQQVFAMATIGGAKALGMEKQIGSIEVGKRADLITISTAAPHAVPAYDVYAMVVYSLKASDVTDVVVEGRVLVFDKDPQTLNADAIINRARAFRLKVEASLKK